MFHPYDEIDLSNPINGKPTKFKIEYYKFFEMFQNEKKIKLKGNSEYFIKKIYAKNIPKYSFGVNKMSESEAKKIFQYIDKEYGIDFVGMACLSHRNKKANINARYHSIEFDDIKEVYENYWEKLREKNSKEFTKNAIK